MQDLCNSQLLTEYDSLTKIVSNFDTILLTVKGWSVTLSFVLLWNGFAKRLWSLFLLSALSAGCFWLLDGQMKGFQMQYYPRMRQIELVCASEGKAGPLIDWSWATAPDQFRDQAKVIYGEHPGPQPYKNDPYSYRNHYLFPVVILPHIFPVVFGLLLAILAATGKIGGFSAVPPIGVSAPTPPGEGLAD
jgi:hypothetical protein